MQEQNTKPNFEKDIELTNESSNSNTSYADNAELAEQEQTATANTDINNASVRDNILSGSDVTINNQESQQTEMVQLEDSKTLADETDSNVKVNSLDADNNLSDNTTDRNISNTKEQNNTSVKALDNNTAVISNTLESNTDSQLSDKDNKTVVNNYTAINTTDTDNTDTVNTDSVEETDRKLSNIEKYNMTLNSDERKEQCRQAGIKSGEARRERKSLADELKLILSTGDNQERVCMALFQSALKGNYKAFNSLRDTIGEMPTVKQEITADVTTDADRQLMDKIANRLNVTEK